MRLLIPLVVMTLACRRAPPTPVDLSDDTAAETEPTNTEPTNTEPTNTEPTGTEPTGTEPTQPQTTRDPVRVMSWNVENLGHPGDDEYDALLRVVKRLDADIIGFNEVNANELDTFIALAEDLGYDQYLVPNENPFGPIRNAMMTRLPVISKQVWTSSMLSGDSSADDVTRSPLSMTVTTPSGSTLTVVSQHWNSGFGDLEEFRRAVDAVRTGQAAEQATSDFVIVMGDVNAETDEVESPAFFSSQPSGAPFSYELGNDLVSQMGAAGIANSAFEPMTSQGLEILVLSQPDGRLATRDSSGRRIDHMMVSPTLADRQWNGEIYDARDEAQSDLGYAGVAPNRDDTLVASDHFAIVVDFHP